MGLLDTEVFPRTNLYDINVYLDEDDFLRITAYHLVWIPDPDNRKDEEGNPIYTFANSDYEEPISLLCLDVYEDYDLKEWGLTRDNVHKMSDSWTTTSEFENDYKELLSEKLMTIVLEQIENYCVPYEADVQRYSV